MDFRKFCLALHSAPRLLTAAVYYNYLNWGTDYSREMIVSVTVLTNVFENIALLLVHYLTPKAGS
jgi:hypothetical protein